MQDMCGRGLAQSASQDRATRGEGESITSSVSHMGRNCSPPEPGHHRPGSTETEHLACRKENGGSWSRAVTAAANRAQAWPSLGRLPAASDKKSTCLCCGSGEGVLGQWVPVEGGLTMVPGHVCMHNS